MTCAASGPGERPGSVIETEVAGFVAGSGKTGVRGPVVSREGALVEKAFLAGLVSGIGQGVASAFQPQAVASGGAAAVANTGLGDIGRAGLGAGAASAGQKVADYMIRRAEQYQPVIQLRADAVVGGEMAGVGFARKHDAFELRVGQEPVGNHAFGQHRPVGRHGMRHSGHGGGLHQRRGMGDGARHPRDARPPRFVGAGIRLRARFVRNGVGGAGLDSPPRTRSGTSSATGPHSWAVAGAAAELAPVLLFVAGGLTVLPNRSRAGPVGMDRAVSGVIGSLGGTLAMTASRSSAALAARASRSMSIPGSDERSMTVSRVSKPVPRLA